MAAQLQKHSDERMRKKLDVDASTRELTNSNLVPSKGASSPSDATSCISSVGDGPGSVKEGDVDQEHLNTGQGVPYPAGGYYGYYYPGYGGSFGDSDSQGYYFGADAGELQYSVTQADNGSYVYLMPGFQTGYSSYFPVSTIGVDGQYIGHQVYPHGSIYEQPIGSPGYYPAPLPYGDLMPLPYSWDAYLTTQDGSLGNGYNESAGKPSGRPNFSSQSHAGDLVSKSVSPPNLSNLPEVKSSAPIKDVSSGYAKRNQLKPLNKAPPSGSVLHSDVVAQGCMPITKYPTYSQGKSGFLYSNNFVKSNTKGWVSTEKSKLRNKVNASGQFCGVAEMLGQVDFNKSMDFWQQDKWNGYFPVKWHIIKDVPNPQLRHIILENNDNKPVTNSRDTQEVFFPQGVEMLNIFKNYTARTSILDDFEFYESRQKVLQEKKVGQSMPNSNIQQIDELTTALGSVDISTVKNIEEPKLVEQVKD